MSAVAGPLAAMAGLLALGGALKVRRPGPTVNALRAVGLPVGDAAVRVGAVAELAIGVGTLVADSPVFPALLALSYAAFTVFVLVALARHTPLDSCGCFGEPDTPPTALHVLVTAGAAGVGIAAAVSDESLADVFAEQAWAGVPLALLAGVIAYLSYLVITVLPRTKVVS
jgi:hypothetical protein